jgi:transposase
VVKWPKSSTTVHVTAPRPANPFETISHSSDQSLSAQQIYQRLAEAGYDGGITIVKDYVHRIRPRQQPAFLKLDFQPGECAQIDWGEFGTVTVGNTRRRLSFFVMVLCYSRRMYLEFTVSQEMEFFLACHENAFATAWRRTEPSDHRQLEVGRACSAW